MAPIQLTQASALRLQMKVLARKPAAALANLSQPAHQFPAHPASRLLENPIALPSCHTNLPPSQFHLCSKDARVEFHKVTESD